MVLIYFVYYTSLEGQDNLISFKRMLCKGMILNLRLME